MYVSKSIFRQRRLLQIRFNVVSAIRFCGKLRCQILQFLFGLIAGGFLKLTDQEVEETTFNTFNAFNTFKRATSFANSNPGLLQLKSWFITILIRMCIFLVARNWKCCSG